jgi:S1-C subfamily serine protease
MTHRRPSTGSIFVQTAALLAVAAVAIAATVWWMSSRRPVQSAPAMSPLSATSTTVPPAPPPPSLGITPPADPAPDLAVAPPNAEPAGVPPAADTPAALEDLIVRVMPAVVTIQTPTSRGSGFFVAPDTLITNVHVVGTESTVTIRRSNGTTTTARVQTTSPAFDIAVLKVFDVQSNQAIIPLGTAASARIGEEVIAIGTPLGFLQNTVSRGIVSGLRDVGGATLVQTDAAINPGNSGGPLLNRSGVAIGVIKSGYVGSDGLSFAVAADHARAALEGRADPAGASTESTPYRALSPAVASPADQRRIDATRVYEDAVAQLAQRADALDRQWTSFAARCYQGRIVGTFDRPWFALWDPRAMQGVVAPGCVPYFDDLRREATDVQHAVATAEEAARQADIYPGVRRQTLKRHKLDYAGWNR